MNHYLRLAITLVCSWICISTTHTNEAFASDGLQPEVYIFRGFVGYWPDASGMSARMSSRGYCPHVQRSLNVPRLTANLVADQTQGLHRPVYLIGYSFGASAAVRMARKLNAQGICVDRMVLIECYDRPEIPPNVAYCVNLYESRPLDRVQPFRGTPAYATDPSSTVLVDIDIATAPEWEEVRKDNHFNIADDPIVQEFAAQQFPNLLPSAQYSAVQNYQPGFLTGRAEVPGVLNYGSPTYSQVRQSTSYSSIRDAQIHNSAGPQFPPATQQTSNARPVVQSGASTRPPAAVSRGGSTGYYFPSSGAGVARPDLSGTPRKTPSTSYRMSFSK